MEYGWNQLRKKNRPDFLKTAKLFLDATESRTNRSG